MLSVHAGRGIVCYLIVEEERVELFNPLLRIRREIMQRRKEEV